MPKDRGCIMEPGRAVPVEEQADIIVAGGGFAGISAALAAARNGASVCLLEREWLLGGLGTLGLVAIFLPLCDGNGRQVIAGIGEELIRLAVTCGEEPGHLPFPAAWLENGAQHKPGVRFQAQYNPWVFALKAEKILLDAGVRIRYGAAASHAIVEDGRITAIVAEDKGGRFAVTAGAFVDATGDADICRMAGAPTAVCPRGNAPAAWHYADTVLGRTLRMIGFSETPATAEEPGAGRQYSGLDGRDLSAFMVRAHGMILDDWSAKRMADPAYAISSLPMIPQVRMTRRLAGRETLQSSQVFQHHPESIGMTGDWRAPGPVYEIPFGSLFCDEVHNLFTAGRCISASDDMWNLTRVIPACTVTGQAAGLAASMLGAADTVPVIKLQEKLRGQGALIHIEDAKPLKAQ